MDLIVLMKVKCDWPVLRNGTVLTAKAAGGVRAIGLLFAVVRVQCKLRRIQVKVWEASNAEGFFWTTHMRGVERFVWEPAA